MPTLNPRTLGCMAALFVIACLTACVPTDRSVVTADVQTILPDLAGEWNTGDKPADRLTFIKAADGKSYEVITYDDDGKSKENSCVLRVMKLGDDLFYEMETHNPGETRNRFAVGRLTVEKDRLRGWTFEKDDAGLEVPEAKTAEVDYGGGNKEKVLAMEPAKVQALLKAHAKEMTKESLAVRRGRAGK
jgi:hypothetical protein